MRSRETDGELSSGLLSFSDIRNLTISRHPKRNGATVAHVVPPPARAAGSSGFRMTTAEISPACPQPDASRATVPPILLMAWAVPTG
jgi:hypothetical protein